MTVPITKAEIEQELKNILRSRDEARASIERLKDLHDDPDLVALEAHLLHVETYTDSLLAQLLSAPSTHDEYAERMAAEAHKTEPTENT